MARPRLSPATRNCAECGTAFPHVPKAPRLTCSDECARAINSRQRHGVKRPGIGGTPRRSPRSVECTVCRQTFRITAQQASDGRRTCSEACRREHLSRAKGGLADGTCEECGRPYRVSRFYLAAGRRFCGDPCRLAWWGRQTPVGEDNPLWKGGRPRTYGSSWLPARAAVWKRDDETCTSCGRTREELGQRPSVHHVRPFREYGIDRHEEANQLDNLVCLCRSCHLIAHWELDRRK